VWSAIENSACVSLFSSSIDKNSSENTKNSGNTKNYIAR
jgi:hypothetical protein